MSDLSNNIENSRPSNNELDGAHRRARVGGSGFTVFAWKTKPILFAKQIAHQSPTPVGPGTTPIHPMDTPYPVELITPQAVTMGMIELEFYELYGSNIWERLPGLGAGDGEGPIDLVGIFKKVAEMDEPITIFKYIKPPNINTSKKKTDQLGAYTEEYHNCVVSQLVDGETINVGTMEVLKQMTVNYTHITRGGKNDVLSKGTKITNKNGVNSVFNDPNGYR